MKTNTQQPQGRNSWLKHLDFIILDISALLLSYFLSYCLHFGDFSLFEADHWKFFTLIICMLDFTIILLSSTFSGVLQRHGSEELVSTLLNALYNFIVCCIILYVMHIGPVYSRLTVVIMYLLYIPICLLIRQGWKRVLYKIGSSVSLVPSKSVLVVGKRKDMEKLLRSVNSGFFQEYQVKALCIIDGVPGEKVTTQIDLEGSNDTVHRQTLEFENTVSPDQIADYILREHVDDLFVNVPPMELPPELYKVLIENGKGIHVNIHPLVGFSAENHFVSTVGTNKTLSVGSYTLTGKQLSYLAVKRIMDILFGLLGTVLMLVLGLFIKIIRLAMGDTKSILYTQTRVGLNGKPFPFYKFRSMVPNADELLPELLKIPEYRAQWDEKHKFRNDPRIDRLGRFLRKTSLDEIPQFFNVLLGQMSLIGPRPLDVGELEAHGGLKLYQQVKPGITGWWGCSGRPNTTYEERLVLEYYYVRNCSLDLDLLCVVKTVKMILQGKGAK